MNCTREKKSSGGRWTMFDKLDLKNYIDKGYLLSEIEQRFLSRSSDAILAQARQMGYGEQKLDNGDKHFVLGVKYRGKNKVDPTEVNSDQTTISEDPQDTIRCHTTIVPHISGKEITLTALNMLEAGSIQINPDSVKDISVLILQYRN